MERFILFCKRVPKSACNGVAEFAKQHDPFELLEELENGNANSKIGLQGEKSSSCEKQMHKKDNRFPPFLNGLATNESGTEIQCLMLQKAKGVQQQPVFFPTYNIVL